MPTYDYECQSCGHSFEEFQMMSDKMLRKCPKCKKNKLKRLIGAGAGLIFKGSGFYETDYKRKSENKENKEKQTDETSKDKTSNDKSENKMSDTKTSEKTETKTEIKKESKKE